MIAMSVAYTSLNCSMDLFPVMKNAPLANRAAYGLPVCFVVGFPLMYRKCMRAPENISGSYDTRMLRLREGILCAMSASFCMSIGTFILAAATMFVVWNVTSRRWEVAGSFLRIFCMILSAVCMSLSDLRPPLMTIFPEANMRNVWDFVCPSTVL